MKNEKLGMDFWGRVEQLQVANGKTNLKQLCKNLGIPYQTLNNARAKASIPNAFYVSKLARELNCSMEFLILGTDSQINLESANAIALQIQYNQRKRKLIEKISTLTEEELHAIEIILKI